jgi:uncharacterized protein
VRIRFGEEFETTYPAALLTAIAEEATNSGSRIHGPDHWWRVHQNGAHLASLTAGADAEVTGLFALFHDVMRENDGHDPEHGPRAADLALRLSPLLGITDQQFGLLAIACENHDRGLTSDEPTIGCCWDADRLDLPRVGTTPRLQFFSTEAGRSAVTLLAMSRTKTEVQG